MNLLRSLSARRLSRTIIIASIAFSSIVFIGSKSCSSDKPSAKQYNFTNGVYLSNDIPVIPGESVGEIQLNMRRRLVKKIYGQPDTQFTYNSTLVYNYPSLGFSVIFYNGRVGAVSCGYGGVSHGDALARAFTGVTSAGIRIGSTQQEIFASYGPCVSNMIRNAKSLAPRWRSWAELSNHFNIKHLNLTVLCYPHYGIDFFLNNDKLNHIDIYPAISGGG